ncbi:MAG: DUF3823 domain-containing protein [Candidatus Azobacteroides sp.]|nr:DUF3823 domain-containing protein [Candidatus Azobacteroides sp.]
MRSRKIYMLIAGICTLLFHSCELDNFDGPDATIYGGIYDMETKELVRQDIVSGAQIEYVEHGFQNPVTQYQIIKNDGTYRNNLMFSGTYTMQLQRGNFVPMDPIEVKVQGDTEINFEVIPYIRIKNAKIEKEDNIITATFNMETTVPNNVATIGLYFHQQATVGYGSKLNFVEATINEVPTEDKLYTIRLDVTSYSSELEEGKPYYFIIGALIDAPQAEAKHNYAPPVRITI